MIQLKQIEKVRLETSKGCETAKAKYENQTAKHKAALMRTVDQLDQKYRAICDQYFDENLIDRNGKTVKAGDLITEDGSSFFKVKERLFSADHKNDIAFPFVKCSRLSQAKLKDIQIAGHELKLFEVKQQA